jgi:hypothetical protein
MLPNTKRSKKEETRSQDYGLQSMTPIYGQVIQASPSWSGPFEAPPIPSAVITPRYTNSNSGAFADMINKLSQQSLMALPMLFL